MYVKRAPLLETNTHGQGMRNACHTTAAQLCTAFGHPHRASARQDSSVRCCRAPAQREKQEHRSHV
eukprot:967110-Rhodomonas_salina.4